ncbi:MAG: LysR family transcriptional regulator [Lachnospiraceae bacterium]|nr:LysR family transcriptional regulator [Lachnospiraceae bacterium]
MTLAQLRYFCTAARYHSITQAAKALFVTQPTISIAIRDLEKEFSVTLFTHTGSRISLTEEGERFYNRASVILSDCEDLQADYSSPNASKAIVRLGIPPMLSTIFFPELLDAFHNENPDVWLELQEYGSVRACALVQNDVLDIAFVNMELPNIDKFQTMTLTVEPLFFGVCKGHPLENIDEIKLEMLDGQSLVLYNQDSVQNRILQTRFVALGVQPRIVMRSSQIPTILKFLRQGQCGCFFYKDVLPLMPEVIGLPLNPEITTRAGLVWRRGRYVSSGIKKFLDFCKSYYS